MATNTMRPGPTGPPRGNTVRPRPEEAPPAPTPEPVAAAPAPAPVTALPPAAAAPARPQPPVRKGPQPLTAEEAEAQAAEWKRTPAEATATGWSLFSLLDRFTGLDGLFREGLPVRYLPKLLFVMALTLLYIGNTHYGNRMNRNIQRIKQEVEDLRADYTTLKSDYMEASKQSEVARKVAAIGLVESSSPPFRISVPAGHLDEAELETMPVLTTDTLAARAARDSIASARADSVEGRVRRQQLGLPTDDTPEAGAPPPGLADENATGGREANAQETNDSGGSSTSNKAARNQNTSIKKYKKAQVVHERKGQPAARSSHPKTAHEKQR